MEKKPNTFQKLIHRILMMRYVSAFLAVVLHPLDALMLKLTRGKHSVAEIVGLPIIHLTSIGAKTGEPRGIPLVALKDGDRLALIASSFGRRHNPGWYYNLKANPKCTVRAHRTSREYLARQAHGEEREKYWQLALSYYQGYDKYKERAAHREIPVMILERAE